MLRYILLILCLSLSKYAFSNEIYSSQKLNQDKVDELVKTDQKIIDLENIIYDPTSTPKEISKAYLEKYNIYKGLFNYTQALENLDLSLEAALLTDEKEKALIEYKIERLFVHFDLLEFDKVIEMVSTITEEDLSYVNDETQGFYYSALAYLEIRQDHYKEGDVYLNKSLELLKKSAPRHLPLVYRKKISLYKKQGLHDKVIDSFEKGLYYAEKYNIEIYIIAMYDDISFYYSEIGDLESALEATRKVRDLSVEFNGHNKSGRLQLLEKKLLEKRRLQEANEQKKIRWIQVGLISILTISLFFLYYFFKIAKRKRLVAEQQLEKNREELERLTKELNESGQTKLKLEDYNLSERQNQIIVLVKQGKTNKEIGAALFISENTVKYHLKIIYDILGIGNRTEL
ncbi:two-component response regulator [unidentified eubacterium SCB49]|nr:two-component response regulator [unidentified eubacterium SCB49]